jgi:prefoldin subunit 5
VALLEVRAKHTNEFTIYLGADYYAEVRAEGAIRLY